MHFIKCLTANNVRRYIFYLELLTFREFLLQKQNRLKLKGNIKYCKLKYQKGKHAIEIIRNN